MVKMDEKREENTGEKEKSKKDKALIYFHVNAKDGNVLDKKD